MTVKELYQTGKSRLEKAGADAPAFDALCLLEEVFGAKGRSFLALHGEESCPAEKEDAFLAGISRREAGVPLQYILGKWDFLSLTLAVHPGVLIPRPETELLCETAAEQLRQSGGSTVLDLCSGTGAVGLGICSLLPRTEVLCVELFDAPYACLEENMRRYSRFHARAARGDVLKGEPFQPERFDAVVSNPPYIAGKEIPLLQKEVLMEPREALFGGEDGLIFYRAILDKYRKRVRPGGFMAFEIGEEQGPPVKALMQKAGLADIRVEKDASGWDRVVWGTVK